jgi:hypothetical protein
MSAKSAVNILRSPSAESDDPEVGLRNAVAAAETRSMSADPAGKGGEYCVGNGAPHPPQNLNHAALEAPQVAQDVGKPAPQLPQNLASLGLSESQPGHCMKFFPSGAIDGSATCETNSSISLHHFAFPSLGVTTEGWQPTREISGRSDETRLGKAHSLLGFHRSQDVLRISQRA